MNNIFNDFTSLYVSDLNLSSLLITTQQNHGWGIHIVIRCRFDCRIVFTYTIFIAVILFKWRCSIISETIPLVQHFMHPSRWVWLIFWVTWSRTPTACPISLNDDTGVWLYCNWYRFPLILLVVIGYIVWPILIPQGSRVAQWVR
jgi:hypothetical protein